MVMAHTRVCVLFEGSCFAWLDGLVGWTGAQGCLLKIISANYIANYSANYSRARSSLLITVLIILGLITAVNIILVST